MTPKQAQEIFTILARLEEKTNSTHNWVRSIDEKVDIIIPKVEQHSESISWLKWGVTGGISALVGFIVELFAGIFNKHV